MPEGLEGSVEGDRTRWGTGFEMVCDRFSMVWRKSCETGGGRERFEIDLEKVSHLL